MSQGLGSPLRTKRTRRSHKGLFLRESKDRAVNVPPLKRSRFFTGLRSGAVRCDLCWRRCVIHDGETGYCGTRRNMGGVLYNLVYGRLSCLESRPIEIKPFFHYWPGSTAMTFSTWSCNFDCPWCQNHEISRNPPPSDGELYAPGDVISLATSHGDQGLCASFQEPTLSAEFAMDLFRLGRDRGLYSCFVSNGYMTPAVLRSLCQSGMDGINIDLKGPPEVYEDFCGDVSPTPVLRNMRLARKLGMHVEVVNLLVTGVNDDPPSIEWIIDQHLKTLGEDVPLHFTRYYPAYRYRKGPTRVKVLEEAVLLARKRGVRFAYVGNVPGHAYENTYCPECGELAIERRGYGLVRLRLKRGFRCMKCGQPLPIRGAPGIPGHGSHKEAKRL